MTSGFHRFVLLASLGVLFHAAYSTAEWRTYARKADMSTGGGVPTDIAIQTLVGLLMAMYAVLGMAGDFREIRASVELSKKSWENARNRPSFYGFNHRGRALHPDYKPPPPRQSSKDPSQHLEQRQSLQNIPDRFLS